MKNDFLTFIFHFFKKCKMICLRNEVIFIFQNRQKMNDPKTHAGKPSSFKISADLYS